MAKVLKEPLLAFLLLGSAIFALFQQVSDYPLSDNAKIVVTERHIQSLLLGFEKVWQRLPTAIELDGLIQNHIREEVLYREAVAMGLDRDDGIVRRRLRQKMEFISEDLADLESPEEQELLGYLAAHQEDYRQPSRFSFHQIYFNTSKRGGFAREDAMALLETLKAQDADIDMDLATLGDPLILKEEFNSETEREIERALGSQFLQSLQETPAGSWQGPITSGFGLHLVRIDERIDGELPELNNVRDLVMRDWASVKRKEANEAFYQSLRKRYKVTVENHTGGNRLSKSASRLSMTNGSK